MATLERDLSRHFVALRKLARDLVGEHGADDLVQDTFLQALRRPPRPGPLLGWLQLVVRRLAGRQRRADRRREQREQGIAPTEVVPSPPDLLAHRETLRAVTDAVLALPEPYQHALLLRYLEDLSPVAIAARTGEPLATIKSRLQRGLAMLRERFARDGNGDDWRAGLAGAFGLGRAGTAGAAAAAGVLIMGTGVKLAIGGGAALAAVVAWLFLTNDAQPVAPAESPGPRSDMVAMSGSLEGSVPHDAAPAERQAAPPPAAPAVPSPAVLRGRCVDEAGTPMAGIRVVLQGRASTTHSIVPASAAWQDPPGQTTPADGRFEFRFAPQLSLSFSLRVGDEDHVGGWASWPEIAPADVVDIGDVPIFLPLPANMQAHVVDTEGMPVAKHGVWLQWRAPPDLHSPLDVNSGGGATTDESGLCTWSRLLPGSYVAAAGDREIVRGGRFVLARHAAETLHEIVVAAIDGADVIRGVLIDQTGAPVARARLLGRYGDGGVLTAETKADGAFRFVRTAAVGDCALQITIDADGFETSRPDERIRWGRSDVRFTLQHAAGLEVLVTDSAGAPVERYRLWVVADQLKSHGDGHDTEVRNEGAHPRGIATVTGLRRGPGFVVVQPDDPALLVSRPVAVLVDGGVRVTIVLQDAAERVVRVQSSDGAPVARTRVRLVDPAGAVPCMAAKAMPMYQWAFGTSNGTSPYVRGYSILLQETTTDAHGQATLRGYGNLALAVGVDGGEHCRTQVDGVRLEDGEPLVITVEVGARLRGRAAPEVLRALRGVAGLPPTGAVLGYNQRRLLPGLLMLRGDDDHRERFPGAPIEFGDDGAFAVDRVPPGTWRLLLQTPDGINQYWEDVTTVTLRDGETSDVLLDLQGAMPCEVSGQLFWNDRPCDTAKLTRCKVELHIAGTDLAGKPNKLVSVLQTDAEGRFRWRGRAGTMTLHKNDRVHAAETVVVEPGGKARIDFHCSSGLLDLRLLDRDAQPVPASLVELFDAGDRGYQIWTGDEGTSSIELAPGTYRVQAQQKVQGKLTAAVALGSATVTVGETTTVTMRLPPR